jgi:hypothetical protein
MVKKHDRQGSEIWFTLIFIISTYSCNHFLSQEIHEKEFGNISIDLVLQQHNLYNGSTFNILHGNVIGLDAYAVSIFPECSWIVDGPLSPEILHDFTLQHWDLLSDPHVSLGTWKDGDKTYIDVTAVFFDIKEAQYYGRVYQQKTIFHLKKLESIDIGGSGNIVENDITSEELLARL